MLKTENTNLNLVCFPNEQANQIIRDRWFGRQSPHSIVQVVIRYIYSEKLSTYIAVFLFARISRYAILSLNEPPA
jgi:hypothetical protein